MKGSGKHQRIKNAPQGDTKVYAETKQVHTDDCKNAVNSREDAMLQAIDDRRNIEKLCDWVDSLNEGKTDVTNFFQGLAPQAAIELAGIMMSTKTSEKVRLDAIKSWLDRSGHGAVNKHAIASVDADTPKEAMINLIMGKKGKLGEEIEIIEDDEEDSY